MRALLAGAFCIGWAPIFVKLLGLEAAMAGFYRCGFAAVLLLVWLILREPEQLRQLRAVPKQVYLPLALAGLFFALDLFFWFSCIKLLGAGIGTILANTQTFYLSAFGLIFLGERLRGNLIFGILAAFIGIYLLVGELPRWVGSQDHIPGLIYGFLTGISYAGYILNLRKAQTHMSAMSSAMKMVLICLFTSGAIAAIALFTGEAFVFPQGDDLLYCLGAALVAQVFGWLLIARGVAQMDVSRAGLALLFQPVCACILAAIFFAENLNLTQSTGAGLTLIGIYFGSKSQQTKGVRKP